MPQPEQFDADEFWDDLLAYVEEQRLLVVVGSELLTIEVEGHTVPLYRAVAEALLTKYHAGELVTSWRDGSELNDAVCALAAAGKRVRDLYRPVYEILDKLVAGQPTLPALAQLAAIRHLDLFATTTPDSLLAHALSAVRFSGDAGRVHEIEYAPKLPTDRRSDIPAVPPASYTAVFYLFGKATVSPLYAIHDEDALEFPYTLQAGNGPERMFAELRNRNLLLIGCNFSDWLSRFFLRLSNSERLFSDQRSKKEFLVGTAAADDAGFVTFLSRFSQDSRCYPIGARQFVAELHERWRVRNPQPITASPQAAVDASALQQLQSGSICISYATDDAAAARALLADVKELGGDVAWFDKQALTPGDEWRRQITAAIQRCSLFLPLLSRNTEGRAEGFFRWEWSEAIDRSRRIEKRRFIIPVIVDDDDAAGQPGAYTLIPDRFKELHFANAPAGRLSPDLKAIVKEHLRAIERARPS